jgi:hypothetical protein
MDASVVSNSIARPRRRSKLPFDGSGFDYADRRERIHAAAAASAAFPVVFHSVPVEQLGQCYDGSNRQRHRLKCATDGGAERVIVIAPYLAAFRRSHTSSAST